MKLSTIFLAGLTSAAETDETAISNLENLRKIGKKFSHSIYEINPRLGHKWDRKFFHNFGPMRRSFKRCGTRDGETNDEMNVEIDFKNPCRSINQVLNGFSMWTDRYIASCNGQKKKSHQKKRFQKWKLILNKGKGQCVTDSNSIKELR